MVGQDGCRGRFLTDLSLLEISPLMMLMAEAAVSKVDSLTHVLGAGRRQTTRRYLTTHNQDRADRREALQEAVELQEEEESEAQVKHRRVQARGKPNA